jgi:pentatricopeptide repeat protein
MLIAGVKIDDEASYTSLVTACANSGDLTLGRVIHQQLINSKFDIQYTLRNALLNLYVKCGCFEEAVQIFNEIRRRKEVHPFAWASVLMMHVKTGRNEEAVELFHSVRNSGAKFDDREIFSVFTPALHACGNIRDVTTTKLIHNEINRREPITHPNLATALINTYAKCQDMPAALAVFEDIRKRKVEITTNTWNAILRGYLQEKQPSIVLQYYQQMQKEGTAQPNDATYTTIIYASVQAGHPELAVATRSLIQQKRVTKTPPLQKALEYLEKETRRIKNEH